MVMVMIVTLMLKWLNLTHTNINLTTNLDFQTMSHPGIWVKNLWRHHMGIAKWLPLRCAKLRIWILKTSLVMIHCRGHRHRHFQAQVLLSNFPKQSNSRSTGFLVGRSGCFMFNADWLTTIQWCAVSSYLCWQRAGATAAYQQEIHAIIQELQRCDSICDHNLDFLHISPVHVLLW